MPRSERVGKQAEAHATLVLVFFGGELCRKPLGSILHGRREVEEKGGVRGCDSTVYRWEPLSQ